MFDHGFLGVSSPVINYGILCVPVAAVSAQVAYVPCPTISCTTSFIKV